MRWKVDYVMGFYAVFNNISVISLRQLTYSLSVGQQTKYWLGNVPLFNAHYTMTAGRVLSYERNKHTHVGWLVLNKYFIYSYIYPIPIRDESFR